MPNAFYRVTGIGPQHPEGSVEIFTVLPHPFKVTKEWLAEQGKYPEMGDELKVSETGVLSLTNVVPQPRLNPDNQLAQKKTDGGQGSSNGSNPSPHKYRGKPIEVEAYEIVGIAIARNEDGSLNLALSNGTNVMADPAMLARITPDVGDYWVVQSDGYVYLNPRDVFLRKYEPITE